MSIVDPTLAAGVAASAAATRKTHAKKTPADGGTPTQHRGQDAVDITPHQSEGNKVSVALGGDKATSEVEKAIASAKTSVQVELYRLGYDKVVDLLASQARKGIKVQVLLDPTPGYDPRDTQAQDTMRKYLETAGVEILKYPIEQKDKIDHVKLLIVDGKTAVIGGLNWDQHSHFNLDTDVVVEGPAVGDLNHVFVNDWKIAGGHDTPLVSGASASASAGGDAKVTVLTTDEGREDIRSAVLKDIQGAKKSIRMLCFAMADKSVIQGLIDAKGRGVDVKVMLDPNKPMAFVNEKAKRTLEAAGIPVRYLKVNLDTEEKLHAKTSMFDDDTVILGSANLTNKGLSVNHEADVEVISKTVGPALTNFFDNLWETRSLEKLPNLPDFEETASPENYGEQVAHNLFGWYNDNYHADEKHNWVGKKKEAILSAMGRYGKQDDIKCPNTDDEAEQIGALSAFLNKRQVWDIRPGPGSYEKVWSKRVEISKEGEQHVAADSARYKKEMVDAVNDPQLKTLLQNILDHAPDGFSKAPSSSTGKFHPADETRVVDVTPRIEPATDAEEAKYPGGGLVLHSRRNLELARHLCDFYGIEGKDRDEILMGEALHDICKFVSMDDFKDWQPGQPVPWGKYTTKEHAHVGAEFVKRMDPSGGTVSEGVRKYIDMHMAAWNYPEPTPPRGHAEMIISLADYLASQADFYVKV